MASSGKPGKAVGFWQRLIGRAADGADTPPSELSTLPAVQQTLAPGASPPQAKVTITRGTALAIAHYGSNNMIAFRYKLRNVPMKIVEKAFTQGGIEFPAGSFIIDAYDLSMPPNDNHLGRWEVSAEQAAENWFGNAVMYGYTLTLPWQRAPQGERVTVRVTFTDSLTGRQFTGQKDVDVKPPATSSTTAPASAPSAAR